jgi:branched-chain amino acid transport system ATP-binding protein
MSTPVLSISNISKAFGGIKAVNDVSFDVQKGEVLGLIGPNGSGKSTLFNCVLGQLKPDQGQVHVNGKSVSGLRAADLNKLGVGRTFQQLSVFPQMSVGKHYPCWSRTPRHYVYPSFRTIRCRIDAGSGSNDPIFSP